MKKKVFAGFCLMLLCSSFVKAQEDLSPPAKIGLGNKLYLKVNAGYGFFTPGSYGALSGVSFEWKSDRVNFIYHDTTKIKHSKLGLGSGKRFGFGIGYIKNDFLNIGIDIEYNQTKGIKSSLTINADAANHYTSRDEMDYRLLTITPHVVFKALAKPKFYLYNKLGVLLTLPFQLNSSGKRSGTDKQVIPNYSTYFNGIFYHDITYTRTSSGDYFYENEDKVKLGVGLNIAFGISFRVNSRLRAFGEVFGNYSALTFSSSKSSLLSKVNNLYEGDSTNFHVEQVDKQLTGVVNTTKYKNGGRIGGTYYNFQDLGVNNEGYYETRETREMTTQRYSINMAVIGVNVGITWRLK